MAYGRSTRAAVQQANDLPGQLGRLLSLPLRNRKALSALLIYLFGLYVSFLASPLFSPNEQQLRQYYEADRLADDSRLSASFAYANVAMKDDEIRNAKTWFWRFDAEKRQTVAALQKQRRALYGSYKEAQREARQKDRRAKSHLGVWSQNAISEAKDLFRTSFQRSKLVARRRTFYDVLFQLFADRESELASRVLQAIFFLVVNLFSAMLGCFILFAIELPTIIYSYGPGVLQGVVFFAIALVGAASVIITFLVVISGAAAGSAYVVVQIALGQQRLQDARRRQQLGGGRHSHRD